MTWHSTYFCTIPGFQHTLRHVRCWSSAMTPVRWGHCTEVAARRLSRHCWIYLILSDSLGLSTCLLMASCISFT